MNLEKHIDKATELHKAAFSKLDDWHRAKEAAKAKLKKEAARLTPEAAREENAKIVQEFGDQCKAIVSELKTALASVEKDFMKDLGDFYAPNGAAIDGADQALLASGILTASELSEMVVKHAENTTMLRIIGKYATERGMKLESAVASALVRATKGGENEQRVFNTFKQLIGNPVRMAEQGLAGTETFMLTALKADEYAADAKAGLLRARVFIDEETKAALQKHATESAEAQNAAYAPHARDYNWI